ncbi:MAG: T9SS type A sorting domain-containing protein [Candidatus Cloacimonetes bacterium]|nr:T9SS type A sorting domain-containing protein [Candidatus Cloacimonadota bacterium]
MNPRYYLYSLSKVAVTALFLLSAVFIYAETLYVVNSQSRTLSKIDTNTDAVNNSFAALGNVPNKIVVDADYIWSVNSGDNGVQKISRITGETLANIFVGTGSNPWDAVKHQDNLYVSGLFTGKVYRINTISGAVTGNVTVGTAPEALHVIGNKLYVANAGNYAQNYAGSSVSVIDLDSFSVLSNIPVNANPQYLASLDGMLHVSCTGNWDNIAGVICIIDSSTDTVSNIINVGGTPGCLWLQNPELALVADSNGMNLFSYNPSTYQLLHGMANPITNGGSEVVGNDTFVAVLNPNWGGNGIVKLMQPDLSTWKQYTVAMMPTDMKLGSNPSSNEDLVMQINSISAYPNPLKQGSTLKFFSPLPMQTELSIFNVKGQKVASYPFVGKDLSLPDLKLNSGIYFYQVQDAKHSSRQSVGKLLVIK